MIAAARRMAGIAGTLLLAGCPPPPHAAWIDASSTAEAVIIRYAADRHGDQPVTLMGLDVYRCTVEGLTTREKAIWSVQRIAAPPDSAAPVPRDTMSSVTYGQVPIGFAEVRPAASLERGACYFALFNSDGARDPNSIYPRTASVGWEILVDGRVREVPDGELYKRYRRARAAGVEPGV